MEGNKPLNNDLNWVWNYVYKMSVREKWKAHVMDVDILKQFEAKEKVFFK